MVFAYEKTDSLCHHGIKGQRWGVRRFQNEDGSLTPAGEKRYNQETAVKIAKTNYKAAASKYGSGTSKTKPYKEALDYQKKKLSDLKVEEKLENHKAGRHETKLIDQYRSKGYSDKEAQIAAYRRVRAEKFVAVSAGVTVAALTAYGVHKYRRENLDSIIPKNVSLNRVATSDSKDVHDIFYASYNKVDNMKYKGMYAGTKIANQNVFNKQFALKKDAKVAGIKTGTKVLQEMVYKNPKYFDDMEAQLKNVSTVGMGVKQTLTLQKAKSALKNGKINKDVYEAMNFITPLHAKVTDDFVSELKSRGYNAITDSNDRRLSGYAAKTATIFFDKSIIDTNKTKVSQLSVKDVAINAVGSMLSLSAEKLAKYSPIGAAAIGINIGQNKLNEAKRYDKIVSDYKKEHPNSTLTKEQILDNYYSNRS